MVDGNKMKYLEVFSIKELEREIKMYTEKKN